jgi:tRNA(Ile)-lysidine synthase
MQLLERVRRTIQRHALATRDTRVVVALSGGSDSVALAHLLLALDANGELMVAGFTHLDHQLRAAAEEDRNYCERLAGSLGREILIDRADVAALARRERCSIEAAARRARYDLFQRALRHFSADVVALGHTRDDQAETFLLRLLRGAGARGLGAMHPRRDAVVRPLLDCRRTELQDYLEAQGIAYVRDETNDDVSIPRNRVRAELLPLLRERFNPSIVDVLAGEASLARDEWQWMEAEAINAAARVCQWTGRVCRIDSARLSGLPPALARLVLRQAMIRAGGGRPVTLAHADDALRFSLGGGASIDLPGQRLERIGSDVVLKGRRDGAVGRLARPAANVFRYPLSIPGEVVIAETGGVISTELATSTAEISASAGSHRARAHLAVVQLDPGRHQLAVRNRRPGDRFRPLGMGGGKKLQDFLVDRKVARERRDEIPLVVDEADRIVWVAGHAIDERFRVTDAAQAVVVLRLRQGGTS